MRLLYLLSLRGKVPAKESATPISALPLFCTAPLSLAPFLRPILHPSDALPKRRSRIPNNEPHASSIAGSRKSSLPLRGYGAAVFADSLAKSRISRTVLHCSSVSPGPEPQPTLAEKAGFEPTMPF